MTLCSYKEDVKNTSLKEKLTKILRRPGGSLKLIIVLKGSCQKYCESVGVQNVQIKISVIAKL